MADTVIRAGRSARSAVGSFFSTVIIAREGGGLRNDSDTMYAHQMSPPQKTGWDMPETYNDYEQRRNVHRGVAQPYTEAKALYTIIANKSCTPIRRTRNMNYDEKRRRCMDAKKRYTNIFPAPCRVYTRWVMDCNDCSFSYLSRPNHGRD